MTDADLTETQYFRQGWLWALLLVGSVPGFLVAVAAIVHDNGGLTRDILPTLTAVFVLVFGPLVVFYYASLRTEVRQDGLYLKLFPVHLRFRRVACADIESVERTSFSPMGDYGGIGVRHNPTFYRWGVSFEGEKAYIAEGGEGIRIKRRDQRPLVIGTQRPEELQAALQRVCRY